jgi:P4 family phage/plasmid primase-like protien
MSDPVSNGIPAEGSWVNVTRADPCPVCEHPDWCSRTEDGSFVICRRRSNGQGVEKTDSAGATYYLHRLNGTVSGGGWDPPKFSHRDGGKKRADPDTLNRVYSALLEHLPLNAAQVKDLRARGLVDRPSSQGKALGYRTLGRERAEAAHKLVQAGLEELLTRVPGFFVQERENGHRYWTVGGGSGLLVPIRDHKRRIVALQVRLDKSDGGGKYRYLSTKMRGGAGPGTSVHFPLFDGKDFSLVRVTEGGIKSDLATHLSGLFTLGLPSVSTWQRAAKALRQLGAKTVRLAFDMDAWKNRHVAEALFRLTADLRRRGFVVELERWDPADGKGIDDLLAAGKQPEVLSGEAATAAIEEMLQAAREADPPPASPTPGDPQAREAINDPHRLARLYLLLRAVHPDRHTLAFYRERFWRWTGARWVMVPDAEMRSALAHFCKRQLNEDAAAMAADWKGDGEPPPVPKVTTALVGNVLQALSGEVLVEQDIPQPSWLDGSRPHTNFVALGNGLLDVDAFLAGQEDNCLLPHTPLWFSPVCFPYNLDPGAKCPKWEAFLRRNFALADPDAAVRVSGTGKVALLQQFAGYLLLPDVTRQRFLLMQGEGANGKSVICAVFRAMLGEGNVSSVPLEFFGEKFHLSETLGKLANVVAEVGELDKVAEGQLKAFTSGDPILFEQKFKAPFTARPTARLVLATNNVPAFSDKTDGLWRRMLLLKFTVQIPECERVAGMDTAEFWRDAAEVPGIFLWALAGVAELRQQGGFVVPGQCREDAEQLRADANPARRFLQEGYQEGEGEVTVEDVYAEYREWCGKQGHHPLSNIGFGREVARCFKRVEKRRMSYAKERWFVYVGLRKREG